MQHNIAVETGKISAERCRPYPRRKKSETVFAHRCESPLVSPGCFYLFASPFACNESDCDENMCMTFGFRVLNGAWIAQWL
jgi:hypothetical protein